MIFIVKLKLGGKKFMAYADTPARQSSISLGFLAFGELDFFQPAARRQFV